jgi:ribosome-binding factor A
METRRTKRLNSLLKEVISEVIRKDVRNPDVNEFVTVTRVDVSKDIRHAKVFISLIAPDLKERERSVVALQHAAGFIAVSAAKLVVLRHFPTLTFVLDTSVDKQMRIEALLQDINKKTAKGQAELDDDEDTTFEQAESN